VETKTNRKYPMVRWNEILKAITSTWNDPALLHPNKFDGPKIIGMTNHVCGGLETKIP
jgi:hypothetical protein